MKRTFKRLSAILLASLMLAALAGCALREKEPADAETTDGGAYTTEELQQVAVQVGNYTITKGDLIDQYDYLAQMYSYYGQPTPTTDAEIEALQDNALDALLMEKVLLYQADLMGVTLDADAISEVEALVDADIKSYMDQYRAQAESEGAADVEMRALEIFQDQLSMSGMDMDVAGFRQYVHDYYQNSRIMTMLQERVQADVSVSDEETQDYYDNLLSTQKESFDAAKENYRDKAEAYQMDGGDPVTYAPEGFVRVHVIQISPEEAMPAEYTTLTSAMADLEKEYGQKALEALADKYAAQGADPASTPLSVKSDEIEGGADLIKQYLTSKATADELYEAYVADARAKADKAYAALEAGDAFADVRKEYGEDARYSTYPSFAETGMLMMKEGDTEWDDKLTEAALKLEAGAYSPVVLADDSFYILQKIGDEPSGERAFADLKEEIAAAALSEKEEEYWNNKLDEWMADDSIVTRFEDVYRDIGK